MGVLPLPAFCKSIHPDGVSKVPIGTSVVDNKRSLHSILRNSASADVGFCGQVCFSGHRKFIGVFADFGAT
jgi:hypothetical protein